jgi:hypothetical protein
MGSDESHILPNLPTILRFFHFSRITHIEKDISAMGYRNFANANQPMANQQALGGMMQNLQMMN